MAIRLHQAGRSVARPSHESVSIERSSERTSGIFEVLTLPSDRALALAELTVEQLLWDAVVRHAGDVACPSDLGITHDEDDAGGVSSSEDFCVRDFILPGHVEKFLETSEMEVI